MVGQWKRKGRSGKARIVLVDLCFNWMDGFSRFCRAERVKSTQVMIMSSLSTKLLIDHGGGAKIPESEHRGKSSMVPHESCSIHNCSQSSHLKLPTFLLFASRSCSRSHRSHYAESARRMIEVMLYQLPQLHRFHSLPTSSFLFTSYDAFSSSTY